VIAAGRDLKLVFSPAMLPGRLRLWAQRTPGRRAFSFLDEGEELAHLSFGELDEQARTIAVVLQEHRMQGERAVLLFPPGLEFLSAFLGCLYAGVVPVPAVPPQRRRGLARLAAIVADAQPRLALVPAAWRQRLAGWLAEEPALAHLSCLSTDDLPPQLAERWQEPAVDANSLAFLQYTSGSTAAPKGVLVSHGNLGRNEALIQEAFDQSEASIIVGWLPLYHDMGLIGNLLQPIWSGSRCILMSPMAFLQRPVRWLEAISRYRATTSGGPNFAYDLCVRRIADEDKAALDLRSWEVAFNGAEPVRAETLDRFAAAFASCGFRRSSFRPCYGLAEATLLVSTARPGDGETSLTVDAVALEEGIARPALPQAPRSRRLVSCGRIDRETRVRIVDPCSGSECPAGQVGEIWVRGDTAAQGYWRQPKATAETFEGTLPGREEGHYLRTGDLGFASCGLLYVTGRLKDLIVIRGRNHHPQDIELTAERSHPALRPGCGAAFALDLDGEERLVVAQEVERQARVVPEEMGEIVAAMRQAIAEEHEVSAFEVVLVRAGTIPKTTSGKVRRQACRQLYVAGELAVLARSALTAGAVHPSAPAGTPPDVAGPWRRQEIESFLRGRIAEALRIPPGLVDPSQPLTALGLDSLAAQEIGNATEEGLGVSLDPVRLLAGITLAEVMEELVLRLDAGAAPAAGAPGTAPADEAAALSMGQQSLWFLQRLAPQCAAYNLAAALRVLGPIDAGALRDAFQELSRRHEALRTTFPLGELDTPVRSVAPGGQVAFAEVDADGWSADELAARLAAEAHRPFDLSREPPLRVSFFRRLSGEPVLLVVIHHIAADFWSAGLLVRELAALYTGFAQGRDCLSGLPRPRAQYGAFVRWQRRLLASEEGERSFAYWREEFAGELPDLDLPLDRPRPRQQSFRGAACSLRFDRGLAAALNTLARDRSATVFMTLLAAFQVLLHRYTGQAELAIGSPASGRVAGELAEVVGYLANSVVLRARCAEVADFAGLLAQTRATALGALAHQSYPFSLLAERLQPDRDPSRSPLFQAMFVHHRPPAAATALAALAVGEPGARLDLGALALESMPLATRASQLDLTLTVAEMGDTPVARLVYDTALFDPSSARRLLGHYITLLTEIAADPERGLCDLPLLSPAERHQMTAEWNSTARGYPRAACVHELFERQVARTPQTAAVVAGDHRLTYEQLDDRANALADTLRRLGVVPEERVGIFKERSADLVVSVLAVLKAGGAFVPLDALYPPARLRQICRDSGMRWLLGDAAAADLVHGLGEAAPALVQVGDEPGGEGSRRGRSPQPEDLAYVLYTSGSTGQPKGVAVPHSALVNLFAGLGPQLGVTDRDIVASFTTLCFDIGVFELLLPLVSGGRLVILPSELAADGTRLAASLTAYAPTVVQATPATWSLLLDAGWRGLPGLRALCGGEALARPLADGLQAASDRAWNMYGPTEAAVYACVHELVAAPGPPPIGRPVANTHFYLCDALLQPVPPGVAGELYIAGDGLARGYWGRPDLTAERFLPEPFSAERGGRMYRTGDLARHRRDGEVEYLGRIDGQVKLRGFRVELDEIRAHLGSHPEVRDAAVVYRAREPGGEPLIVAYVVASGEPAPAAAELHRFLAGRLPRYMVPEVFVELAALPLTPNGKVDRKALPPPLHSPLNEGFVAPRTPVEEALAGIWAGLLALDRVGVRDNFFQLGGHSLKAAQVIARLRDLFHVELPLSALFNAPTVESLAQAIEAARAAAQSPFAAIPALPPAAVAPVSFAQQRIWFFDHLQPGSAAYNMPLAIEMAGALDVPAFAASLAEIVRRHAVLRAAFPARNGRPVQVLSAEAAPWELSLIDLAGLPAPRRAAESRRLGERAARLPFDLERGPVFRAVLVQLEGAAHLLLLTVHHIAADGTSLALFLHELGELYSAAVVRRPAVLPLLPVSYADYSAWQRRDGGEEGQGEALAYWRRKLGAAPPLELPGDRPRPPVQSFRGGVARLALGPGLPELAGEVRRQGVTSFIVLCAAFTALLHRYTGQRQIVVGTPVDGRDRLELEPLLGVFVNVLVLATPVAPDLDGAGLLGHVRDDLLAAYAHRRLPFELLVDAVQPQRSLSHNPLVQATVAFEPSLVPPCLPGLEFAAHRLDTDTAKFDLSLSAAESPNGWVATLEYSADLFDPATAARLLAHLAQMLASLLVSPALPLRDLPLLDAGERHQLLFEWNDTAVPAAAENVCDLFELQARRAPESPALIADAHTWSYGELDRWANGVAHRLRALGVAAEVPVAVCMPRSPEMIVAGLAVLKAGGAYLPLDPSHPLERLREMVADAAPAVVLTLEPWHEILAGGAAGLCVDPLAAGAGPAHTPPRRLHPENLAYVIYTSGSSGRPKGVAVPHAGLLNLVRWHQRTYGITAADRATQLAGPAFDAAVWEVWPYLTAGASLRLIGAAAGEVLAAPAVLRGWLARSQLSLAFLPTPLAEAVLAEPAPLELGLRALLTGGDRLRAAAPAGGPRLINHYGPTENSVVATAAPVAAAAEATLPPPIGRPIDNVRVFLLDAGLQPVAIGVPGEIHLAGLGLARGYLRRPELTAQVFIPSPFAAEPGARLYRTGDRARRLRDGSLDFLGRLDHQVKIRGFRVELGEIEAVLLRHPEVREGLVMLRDDAAAGQRLVAYFVAAGPEPPAAAGFRDFLGALLPDYMVPSAFVALERLPLTANGKVDRAALPSPEAGRRVEGAMAPRTPLEELLADLWSQLLGVEQVGVHESFFALGGHSLQIAQMQSRLRDLVGVELPLQTIFREPTVAQLATHVTQRIVDQVSEEMLIEALAALEGEDTGAAGR
jgi:amino acid adenylation domain-containing protein